MAPLIAPNAQWLAASWLSFSESPTACLGQAYQSTAASTAQYRALSVSSCPGCLLETALHFPLCSLLPVVPQRGTFRTTQPPPPGPISATFWVQRLPLATGDLANPELSSPPVRHTLRAVARRHRCEATREDQPEVIYPPPPPLSSTSTPSAGCRPPPA